MYWTAHGVPRVGHFLDRVRMLLTACGHSVHTISASHTLGATTLALLVYTINLHIFTNVHFLQVSPLF